MTQLRRLRLEKNMTLRSIGERINATPQTVHDTEVRGIRTIKTAKRYAAVFGCDWRDLLDEGESDRSDLLATAEACADGSAQSDASKK